MKLKRGKVFNLVRRLILNWFDKNSEPIILSLSPKMSFKAVNKEFQLHFIQNVSVEVKDTNY